MKKVNRRKFNENYKYDASWNKSIYYSNSKFYVYYKSWIVVILVLLNLAGWIFNSFLISPKRATEIYKGNIGVFKCYEVIDSRKII